jgi:[acyl-carrier-protein] S-malonyltransferase
MSERGIVPDMVAGLSLGEFSALCAAGILSEEQVFSLVYKRGLIMDKACKKLNEGTDKSAMAAVMGLGLDQVNQALKQSGVTNVYSANNNSPVQIVISGMESGFAAAEEALKAAGAKRIIRLAVAGPFHTPLMEEAARGFAGILGDYAFSDPKIACYSNVTGTKIDNGVQAKELAVSQITGNVLWVQEETAMAKAGVGRLFETGPGTVLSGLWQAFTKTDESLTAVACKNAGTLAQIENIQ